MRGPVFLVLCIFFSALINGQNRIIGKYQNHFGESIELKIDSTFKHSWRFDLASSWTQGKWKFSNDTLYLKTELVLDTLNNTAIGNTIVLDSLVISADPVSNRIEIEEYAIHSIASGGQNRKKVPERLFFKNEKFYLIDENGEIDGRKVKEFWTGKKYKTFFKKVE